MATFYEAKSFFLVCSFITVLFAFETERPAHGELVQFQLDRFLSHKQLEFEFSGEHYKVQLVANHDLIHDESTPLCHYFGYVLEPTKYSNSSNLALSLCPNRGIRGSITTHDVTLSIMPSLSSSPPDNHQLTDDHLISKQFIRRTPSKHLSRHLLGYNDRIKIEVYVLSDPAYTKMYKDKYSYRWKDQLIGGVKELMNEASAEYSWWNWGNLGYITLNIIALEIVEDFDGIYAGLRPNWKVNKETGRTCSSGEHWSNTECRGDAFDYLPKFTRFTNDKNRYGDVRLVLTNIMMHSSAGLAYTSVACTSNGNGVIANPIYNWRIRTIAHEIGHTLGMNHDDKVGVMGTYPSREERLKKGKVYDPITGAETLDHRKMGWGQKSENEIRDYFDKSNDLSCAKDGVRSFKTIHNPSSGGSTSGGSSGDCVEIGSVSSYVNGEWRASGTRNGKPRYSNPNSRGLDWLYWTGSYWTMNDNYNSAVNADAYCREARITDCSGSWTSYGYRLRDSRFSNCGSFNADEQGMECLRGNEYKDSVCVFVDGYKEFKIADMCYNDKPVYEYVSDDISYHLYADAYYKYFGNHSNATVDEWIISLHDVASRDTVAICDEADLLQCLREKWRVVYEGNDTISMVVDETISVENDECGVSSTISLSSTTTVVVVWICIALGLVVILSIFAFCIYRRSKQSKQVVIGDDSEDEAIEDGEEEEIEVAVDTKLTETQ